VESDAIFLVETTRDGKGISNWIDKILRGGFRMKPELMERLLKVMVGSCDDCPLAGSCSLSEGKGGDACRSVLQEWITHFDDDGELHYLEVIFGDNDFGSIVRDALAYLWGVLAQNSDSSGVSEVQLVLRLHEAGVLLPVIRRLCFLVDQLAGVERGLRGCYSPSFEFRGCCSASGDLFAIVDADGIKGLEFELKFHRGFGFARKWANGEHAWLDLDTGEVETF